VIARHRRHWSSSEILSGGEGSILPGGSIGLPGLNRCDMDLSSSASLSVEISEKNDAQCLLVVSAR
jgi:hypothetical protein